MPKTIIPIARVEHEARQAARQYSCINAACPYPFASDAGKLFKQIFLQARQNLTPHTPGTA